MFDFVTFLDVLVFGYGCLCVNGALRVKDVEKHSVIGSVKAVSAGGLRRIFALVTLRFSDDATVLPEVALEVPSYAYFLRLLKLQKPALAKVTHHRILA